MGWGFAVAVRNNRKAREKEERERDDFYFLFFLFSFTFVYFIVFASFNSRDKGMKFLCFYGGLCVIAPAIPAPLIYWEFLKEHTGIGEHTSLIALYYKFAIENFLSYFSCLQTPSSKEYFYMD